MPRSELLKQSVIRQIQSAKARQAGSVAQAEADTGRYAMGANQKRDVELARLRAQTEAENAEADQAGPLAQATAEKAVGIAREQAEAARVEARTEVERRRAQQSGSGIAGRCHCTGRGRTPSLHRTRRGVSDRPRSSAPRHRPSQQGRPAALRPMHESSSPTLFAPSSRLMPTALRARLEAEADGRKVAADAVRAEQQAEAEWFCAPSSKPEAAGKRQIAGGAQFLHPAGRAVAHSA